MVHKLPMKNCLSIYTKKIIKSSSESQSILYYSLTNVFDSSNFFFNIDPPDYLLFNPRQISGRLKEIAADFASQQSRMILSK